MLVPMKGMEAEIDRLYQLPLDTFTAERNALAKRAGSEGDRIRELNKPAVPAWAVNQLYWQDRAEWNALIASAENLRKAHKAVLAGRDGDVRAAGTVHDDAVESALKAVLRILESARHSASDATRQGILNTLRALPVGEAQPGRLTTTLQPGGFEMLAGLAIAGAGRAVVRPATSTVSPPLSARGVARRGATRRTKEDAPTKTDARASAMAAARHEAASSARGLREAEQATRRDEFESARAAREERRASDAVAKATEALARAKADFERAEAILANAHAAREAAEVRVLQVRQAMKAARIRAEAASTSLKKLTPH